MKVLIIDDSDDKFEKVKSVLLNRAKSLDYTISRARSFLGAVTLLKAATFDLVILDLVLPLRDEGEPRSDVGVNILSEILEGKSCKRPGHIVCLTEFVEVAKIMEAETQRCLVHLVIYQHDSLVWREKLALKAEQVADTVRQNGTEPATYDRDIAILTSSPQVELRQVLRSAKGFEAEFNRCDSLHYYHNCWDTTAGRKLNVVACAAPTMGMTAACATAMKVIHRWRPRYLVMTGISAGTQKEQSFGDILVAESSFDYGSGKIQDDEDGGRQFIPSPQQLRIDREMHAILQAWERDQRCMADIANLWTGSARATLPKLHLGVLASGAAVVQSSELVASVLANSRKVVGIDMEAYAVFNAAHLACSPRPKVLVAKSISDFADQHKGDDWQEYAAYTSAFFVYQFFTKATELPWSDFDPSETPHSEQ